MSFDLAILDIMMPGMDGFELCQELRKRSTIPLIFLSAKGEETDKVIGFMLGADDYVSKPFKSGELIARVKARLRRANWTPLPLLALFHRRVDYSLIPFPMKQPFMTRHFISHQKNSPY